MASNFAGTLLGITNCAANMMGVVAPAVAGYLTQVGTRKWFSQQSILLYGFTSNFTRIYLACNFIFILGPQWRPPLEGGVLCGCAGLYCGQHHLFGLGQRQGTELEQGGGWRPCWRRGRGSICRIGWLNCIFFCSNFVVTSSFHIMSFVSDTSEGVPWRIWWGIKGPRKNLRFISKAFIFMHSSVRATSNTAPSLSHCVTDY